MRPSKRALGVSASETLRLFGEVAALRAAGQDVISLLEGEPDLPVPPPVTAAVQHAVRGGQTRYSASSGLPELRLAVARKLARQNGVPAKTENVLITNGAKQAIYTALQTLCGPGDEVLIPAPYWVTFPEAARLAGARPVFVPALGHRLDVDAIGRAVTGRTKALILNTPNNPTGAVYSQEALAEVVKLAKKNAFWIIADEAYEQLVYDGRQHLSIASLGRDAAQRTVTIQTFSKSYSMTGFRVGYLAAPAEFTTAAAKLHGHVTGNVCTFAQHGAIAALALGTTYHEARRKVFEKRRDLAYREAAKSFDLIKPRGGLFVFADARRFLGKRFKTSSDLAGHLLTRAKVAVLPGSACGLDGHLRMSFSGSEDALRLGFTRLAAAL